MSKKRRLTETEIAALAAEMAKGKRLKVDKYKRSDIEKIVYLADRIRSKNTAPVGGGCSDPGKTLSSTENRGIWGFFDSFASEFYTMDANRVANDESMLESLRCFAEIFTQEMRLNSNRARNCDIIVDQVALDKIEARATEHIDHLYKDAAVIKLNGEPVAMVTIGKCENKHFIDLFVIALPGDYSRHSFPYFHVHTRIGTQDFVDTAAAAATVTSHLLERDGIDRQYMPPKQSQEG